MKPIAETKLKTSSRSDDRKGASQIAQEAPDFAALYPLRSVLGKDGRASSDLGLSADQLRHMMEMMIWNRELDDRLTKLQRQGRIGFHIGSVGEEAVMIGTAAASRPADWIAPCYREMGVALYRGMPLDDIVANMFGTAADPVQGRQMPCHYVDQAHNFLSISSPIATQITQATGVGWGMRLKGSAAAVLSYFGDGSTSAADFHLGLNFAGVYRAAVVFVCRNNQWAISTPIEAQTRSKTIAQKAIAYGIPSERVDGNDILAVFAATHEAMERARRGEGPTLLEMVTYRVGAHSTSDDPRAYRDEREVEPWRRKDPIERFRAYLEERKLWEPNDEVRIRAEVTERLHAAISKAERTPLPSVPSMFEGVFSEKPWFLKEQQAELEAELGAGYAPTKHT